MTTRLSFVQSVKLILLISILSGTLTVGQAQNQPTKTRVPKVRVLKTQTRKQTPGANGQTGSQIQSEPARPAGTTSTQPRNITGR